MVMVRYTALISIVALLLVVMHAPTAAGRAQTAEPTLAITKVDATSYPQLTAVLTALDSGGVPVEGLQATDFSAFDGDVPLSVSKVETARLGLAVAVVIDTSGSMDGQSIVSARAAAREFIDTLGPDDVASVYAFSTEVHQVAPFTKDRVRLATAIDSLQAEGNTSLFEAAQTAVEALRGQSAPRKAVVLLTDGENRSPSAATFDSALGVARDSRLPVYSIGFGDQPDTSFLQALAQATNGAYRTADAGSVRGVYREIARVLDTQYTLTLRRETSPAAAGGTATLRIRTTIGGQPTEASATFERPAPPATVAAPSSNTTATGDDGGGPAPLVIYGGVVGAIVFGMMAVGAATVFQRTRTRRRQLAIVAPNLEQAIAQPLPPDVGAPIVEDHGFGQLFALDGPESTSYQITSSPLRIGSSPECEVRVPASPDVAGRHATVWMRDHKIMLRHIGGARRRTLVAGQPVEWVILEPGDEFTVGEHRYRADST